MSSQESTTSESSDVSNHNTQENHAHHGHVDEWEIDNLPNRLTIFRILLIPVVIGSLFLNTFHSEEYKHYTSFFNYLAAWTFVAASITDFFDGYIARQRKIVTVFGSFLDPIADKFLVVSSLIMLNYLDRVHVLVVIALVIREMYMTALRLLAIERGLSVPVSNIGKWKTTFQMVAIPLLMANDNPYGIPFTFLGNLFIYLAFFFSTFSAIQYTWHLIEKIKAARAQKKLKKQTSK